MVYRPTDSHAVLTARLVDLLPQIEQARRRYTTAAASHLYSLATDYQKQLDRLIPEATQIECWLSGKKDTNTEG